MPQRSMMNASRKAMARRRDNDVSGMIKALRAGVGLTQEQFAAKVGVTWSTINRWENGRGKPSPLAMRQIKQLQHEQGQR